jgi:hypothetical protein
VPERISPETQKLLERAQRAIEDAISLRENTRDQIASARQQRLLLEIMLSQFPPPANQRPFQLAVSHRRKPECDVDDGALCKMVGSILRSRQRLGAATGRRGRAAGVRWPGLPGILVALRWRRAVAPSYGLAGRSRAQRSRTFPAGPRC